MFSSLSVVRSVFGGWVVVVLGVALSATPARSETSEPVVWNLESLTAIGGQEPQILGRPNVAGVGAQRALYFNGETDGVFLPINPIAGWPKFTVEALIKPDGTGDAEQRFFHIEDSDERRLLIETRVTPDRQWALDTFLFVSTDARLALIDRTKLHPTDQWYWVALVFDGTTMSHFVNGEKELEGAVAFQPMVAGRTSIGVRLNEVFWYKGCIREVRFTPDALTASLLQSDLPK